MQDRAFGCVVLGLFASGWLLAACGGGAGSPPNCGELSGLDCNIEQYCCMPEGTGGPTFCRDNGTACRAPTCLTDADCGPDLVCCPSMEGGFECRSVRVTQETVCGECRDNAGCPVGSVCCQTFDGTVCVQGTSCDADPPDAGVDAGNDPPSTPIPTSAAPEEASEETVESSAAAGLAAAVRMAIVPGTGEITVHNLLTGEVLQEIMSSPSNTGAFVVRDGAQPYLLSIGNDGASVRGWSGTQWGLFGQVLFTGGPTNVTDASKVLNGGQAGAAILTDNSNSQIHYLSYDSAQSLWALSRPTNIPPENGARAVSAAAPVGDSPVLVAVDGTPGRLWWVDWSVTPAVLTDLGTIGDAPRRTSCSPDGTRCFVPNFGSGTVTVVDTSGATPVVLPAVDVGAGPISVSVAVIGGEIVAVTSGFTDDSLTYLVVETGGIRTVSETLPDCSNPGHAVLLPDLGRVLVTCNADDTYVMRALPANVP